MKKIIFELETITPMFISGADQRRAELRAPSIKGLMRFWWRALQAEPDPVKLKKREDLIFGSSSEDTGASGFNIRVSRPDRKPVSEYRNSGRDDPVGYHFYSAFIQRDRKRPYFPEGTRFNITLSSRNERTLGIASASLWLLIHAGGIGMRTRRGAGNITVLNLKDPDEIIKSTELEFTLKKGHSEDIADWYIKNLRIVKNILSSEHKRFVTAYSNLVFSRFVISESSYNSWKEALTATGFKDFRTRNKHRFFETAVFGFPVQHRDIKDNKKITFKGKINSEWINRRSSPIIFKIIKSNDKFFWMVLRLSGEFLPEGGVITNGKRSRKPDYKIIDEFWNSLKQKGKEYILSMPEILQRITESIVKELNATKIILFGSRARGDAHDRSDIDIAVETTGSVSNSNLKGQIDIVDLKHADQSLKKIIDREGVVIYERES